MQQVPVPNPIGENLLYGSKEFRPSEGTLSRQFPVQSYTYYHLCYHNQFRKKVVCLLIIIPTRPFDIWTLSTEYKPDKVHSGTLQKRNDSDDHDTVAV